MVKRKKEQKDKQRSTKHAHKTKDRVTRTPLKTGVNSGAPEGWAVPVSLVALVVLHHLSPPDESYYRNWFVRTKFDICVFNSFFFFLYFLYVKV